MFSAFKATMLPQMQSLAFGNSVENWARSFAQSYDIAIRSGKTTVTSIPIMQGNRSAMESMLITISKQTAMSQAGSLLQSIGPAVISYWAGAQLMLIPPLIPCPGSIANIAATSAPVINPGTWTPMPVPPNNNPMTFLNAFATAASIHLTTVSGIHFCVSNYPGVPVIVAPGVLPWTGYMAI